MKRTIRKTPEGPRRTPKASVQALARRSRLSLAGRCAQAMLDGVADQLGDGVESSASMTWYLCVSTERGDSQRGRLRSVGPAAQRADLRYAARRQIARANPAGAAPGRI